MPTKLKLFSLLTSLLLLSSCATTSQQPAKKVGNVNPQVLHQQHMDNIDNIKQFSLKGRLGVVKQPKGFSGRLKWKHQTDQDNIDVFSPFGGKVASIVKTANQVTLTKNNGENIQEQDVETLTEKTLGFRLPLAGLSYWALGKPADKGIVNYVTWDENGRINTLQQNGWHIKYKNYTANGRYFLPGKIILKNQNLTLKLLVEKWSGL